MISVSVCLFVCLRGPISKTTRPNFAKCSIAYMLAFDRLWFGLPLAAVVGNAIIFCTSGCVDDVMFKNNAIDEITTDISRHAVRLR